jgi:hypothetical protein
MDIAPVCDLDPVKHRHAFIFLIPSTVIILCGYLDCVRTVLLLLMFFVSDEYR